MGEDDLMEGRVDRGRIKDKSLKYQIQHQGAFLKEMVQEANFKKRTVAYDTRNLKNRCVKNTFNKLHKEGLVPHVKGFMLDGLKIQGH